MTDESCRTSFKGIETSIGYISSGRGAVYLDSLEQKNSTLVFKGEINSRFCLPEYQKYKWYSYRLILKNVKVYRCENIEIYPWKEWNCDSSFSEVINSEWHKEYRLDDNLYRHLIIETYDFFYSILCKEFELEIINKR